MLEEGLFCNFKINIEYISIDVNLSKVVTPLTNSYNFIVFFNDKFQFFWNRVYQLYPLKIRVLMQIIFSLKLIPFFFFFFSFTILLLLHFGLTRKPKKLYTITILLKCFEHNIIFIKHCNLCQFWKKYICYIIPYIIIFLFTFNILT